MQERYEEVFIKAAKVFFVLSILTALAGLLLMLVAFKNRGGLVEIVSIGISMAIAAFMSYVWMNAFRFLGDLTVHLDYYHKAILNIEKQAKDRSESVEKRLESIEKRAEYTRQIIREMRDHQAGEKV